jgi:hypothetical protein
MQHGARPTGRTVRWFYPDGFQVLAVADSRASDSELARARRGGDILLFPAWFDNPASRLIENFARYPGLQAPPTGIPGAKGSRD